MKNLKISSLVFCGYLALSTSAHADVVTDWNAIANQIALPARPGATGILDLAIVHAAMHDAIQAYEGRFETYADPISNPTGSPIAASASAARDVLAARFPAQAAALTTQLNTYLNGLGLLGNSGVAVGQHAALRVLNLRVGDGSFPANPEVFNGGTLPGEWRPTPPLSPRCWYPG